MDAIAKVVRKDRRECVDVGPVRAELGRAEKRGSVDVERRTFQRQLRRDSAIRHTIVLDALVTEGECGGIARSKRYRGIDGAACELAVVSIAFGIFVQRRDAECR